MYALILYTFSSFSDLDKKALLKIAICVKVRVYAQEIIIGDDIGHILAIITSFTCNLPSVQV